MRKGCKWCVISMLFLVSTAHAQVEDDAKTTTVREYTNQAVAKADKHDFAGAIEGISKAMKLGFKTHEAYYYRGRWHFQNGDAAKSVADFDKVIELAPKRDNSLWERGISCYYVDDFKGGAQQFVKYQSYHDADVENAVWRYFCQQKTDTKKQARKDMLPIEGDRRVGMMEIYRLFKGESTPEKVMAEVDKSETKGDTKKNELMHAHLYLSMFFDSEGGPEKAKAHIDLAVEQFEHGHYMWAVAVMHQKHLAALAKKSSENDESER